MADELLAAIGAYRKKSQASEDESLFSSIKEYRMKGMEPSFRSDQEKIEQLRQVPQAINRGKGLPVGEEPMVGGPDILAL